MKSNSEMIYQILAWFDFEKVHKVMTQLDWKWVDTENGVPSVVELKESAFSRLEDAISGVLDPRNKIKPDTAYYSNGGGLKATAIKDKNNKITDLNLEFILEEYDVQNY